jgi:hypothetical protein
MELTEKENYELSEKAIQVYLRIPLDNAKELLTKLNMNPNPGKMETQEHDLGRIDFSTLDDEDIGKYYSIIMGWYGSIEETLAVIATKVTGCKEALEYVEASLKKQKLSKEAIISDPNYLNVNTKLIEFKAEESMLIAKQKKYEHYYKFISRELTRRTMEVDKKRYGIGD